MKAIKPGSNSYEMARSTGFTTGNFIIDSGVKRRFPSGPKLEVEESNSEIQTPKFITVSFNEEKCYKCGLKNIEYRHMPNGDIFGTCRVCDIKLKLREMLPFDKYNNICGR